MYLTGPSTEMPRICNHLLREATGAQ